MKKTRDILNWHFKVSDFKYTAEHLFINKTKKTVKISLNELRKIAEDSTENKLPEPKLVNDVYTMFQKNCNKEYAILYSLFSKRDVRVLVWALDYKPNLNSSVILFSEQFEIAQKIITDKWKDSFIISLWHILLKNWNSLQDHQEQRDSLTNLLNSKCNEYNRSRKDILNISTNISLFSKLDSAESYANKLLENKILLNEAHTLINQKESILGYNYFESVAIFYVDFLSSKMLSTKITQSVLSFLKTHNTRYTSLIICSTLINRDEFKNDINIIKDQSIQLIGDPLNRHAWNYSNLSDKESKNIELARIKLNILLNKHFLKYFFEELIDDARRKVYWMKFIENVEEIRFCGSKANYYSIKRNSDITQFVDSRFQVTRSKQQTSAIIIYSKGFVFVEFSDVGALYIYLKDNFKSRVNLNNLQSIDDLKLWSRYKYACKNSTEKAGHVTLNKEGRILHQGDWESKIDVWMKEYYYDINSIERKEIIREERMSKSNSLTSQKDLKNKDTKHKLIENINQLEKQKNKISDRKNQLTYNTSNQNKDFVEEEFKKWDWETKVNYWRFKRAEGYTYSKKKKAWYLKK